MLLAKRSKIVLMSRRPISTIIGAVVMPVMFATLFFTIFGRVMERVRHGLRAVPAPPRSSCRRVFPRRCRGSGVGRRDASSGHVVAPAGDAHRPVGAGDRTARRETVRGPFGLAILIAIGYAVGFRLETGVFALALIGIIVVASVAIVPLYLVLGYAPADPEATQAIGGAIYFLVVGVDPVRPEAGLPGWLQPIVQNQPLPGHRGDARGVH